MPHPRGADHFFLVLSAGEGAWVLRGAEGRETTGITRAGVEADRPVPPLEGPRRVFVRGGSANPAKRRAGSAGRPDPKLGLFRSKRADQQRFAGRRRPRNSILSRTGPKRSDCVMAIRV